MELVKKYELLKEIIKDMGRVMIAYSGGVDSALLAKVAYDVLGDDAVALTVRAPMHPEMEMDEAEGLANEIGINHVTMIFKDEAVKVIEFNPVDRCYHCKKEIFSSILEKGRELNMKWVADGSNVDDLCEYRPGRRAIEELGVRSPLIEAKLTKKEIRELSKMINLKTWDKPAFSCLATRFPYGEQLTTKKFKMVEEAEKYFSTLNINQFRIRLHDNIARIEVAPDERHKLFNVELLDSISEKLKSFGFDYVTFELCGYKSGSMDINIEDK